MKNKRVLHVVASINPKLGGVSQALRDLIIELKKINVDNEIVCLDSKNDSYIKSSLFSVHAIGPSRGSWCYSAYLIPWLVSNLARFDSVILHGLWLYTGYAVNKACSIFNSTANTKKRACFFIMPHGMLDPYFQRAKNRRFKAIRNWLYWKLIECHVVSRAEGLLFTSKTELDLARIPFAPFRPKKEIIVGLGIKDPPICTWEMKEIFIAKFPQLKETSYLLCLSRIDEKKGIDILIKAYGRLLQEQSSTFKTSPLPKLVIAGPGTNTPYGISVRKLALTYNKLEENILFCDMLEGEAKWSAFYGCEAFVLPSHQENFGIAVVEALACCKPVLISNKINIYSKIEASNGGLVENDTIDGTTNILKTWTTLPREKKRAMEISARLTFEKYFSISLAAKRLNDSIFGSQS